jgi:invasion protein IalB
MHSRTFAFILLATACSLPVIPAMAAKTTGTEAQIAQSTQEGQDKKPQAPLKTTSQQFGGWAFTCSYFEKSTHCVLVQKMVGKDKKQVLVSAIVSIAKEGGAELVLQVPTGLDLTPGLELAVDGKTAGKAVYRACAPRICEASIPLDKALLNKLAAGKQLTLTMTGMRGKKVKVEMPLASFTEAYTAFQKEVTKTN